MLPSLRFVGACPVRKCPERPPLWQGGWGRCPESKTFQGGEGGVKMACQHYRVFPA